MPQVTKLFELTFEEPEMDWINAGNIELVLGAAFSGNEEESYKFNVRDLTNREQYEEKFARATDHSEEYAIVEEDETTEDIINTLGIPEDQLNKNISIEEKILTSDIQKRNEELRAKVVEKKVGPPHAAPGTGKMCPAPEILKEKLRTGGAISFCPACGHQYSDTDLLGGK